MAKTFSFQESNRFSLDVAMTGPPWFVSGGKDALEFILSAGTRIFGVAKVDTVNWKR